MQGQGTVKNPLTVIAIFAGTAEISGTAILPLLDAGAQSTYIWFLMLFPFTLIALFFITLNWNHKVLYAPSDFKDEDHFINILQKASLKDQIEELGVEAEGESEDLNELEDADSNISEVTNQQPRTPEYRQTNECENPLLAAIQLAEENSKISNKETRELHRKLMGVVHRTSKRDSEIAEKMVLEKLENELGVKIENDMKFEFGRNRYVFDGIARSDNQITAIDVKFMRDLRMGMDSMILRTLDRAQELYNSLSEVQKKEFSFIFAIVTDNLDERRLEFIKNRVSKMGFPAVVKVYDFDSLASELLENAS
ncbi:MULTISPECIES: hypothetical protein [unclassified Shewanella]|uniref:hypothetical protein n=1 Tax=unclassified Shewanella TaxID=196818 RepID=UPI0021D8624D|nr:MULTISPECIES: hypothetical protein [unclassified Shewanella]MCU8035720.1 hypothetical protein [Shewanella sp. SM71]MCU8097598.1 hypothetical protein [Shewanella sp. SM102]